MSKQVFSFESMGTNWNVSIWDKISNYKVLKLKKTILESAEEFDNTYSRFIKSSLVVRIENKIGKIKVPTNFINILLLYGKMYDYSNGVINPLIGHTISDLGYDADYSLKKSNVARPTPNFSKTIKILDENHIQKNAPALFDFGAIGKGYFVDLASLYLYNQGIKRFLVNGSGDIYYQGEKEITVGLEHPDNTKKVIGSMKMKTGAMCASGVNRRKWDDSNHIINPISKTSVTDIIATWVVSESAAVADGLSTALFLCHPENFTEEFRFEYLILNKNYMVKRSKGFKAVLY